MVEIKVGQVYDDLVTEGWSITILGDVDNASYGGSLPIMRHLPEGDVPGVTNLCALGRYYKLREESND